MKRPDLVGHLLQPEGSQAIFLVDEDGTRRYIPDPQTFANLFGDYWGPEEVLDIESIDQGPNLSQGAILAKDPNMAAVYFIDNGVKRWVSGPAVMDKFHFSWKQIQSVPNIVLSFVPSGPDMT